MTDVIDLAGLPAWVLALVLAISPVLSFVGALVGPLLLRVGEKEADIRWRREKALEHMRWAVELSASENDQLAEVGGAALNALVDSPLLHEDDVDLILQVTDAAVGEMSDEVAVEEVDVELVDEEN